MSPFLISLSVGLGSCFFSAVGFGQAEKLGGDANRMCRHRDMSTIPPHRAARIINSLGLGVERVQLPFSASAAQWQSNCDVHYRKVRP
jgi:hypothetical protein